MSKRQKLFIAVLTTTDILNLDITDRDAAVVITVSISL